MTNNKPIQLQSKLESLLTSLQLGDAPAGGSVVVYHHGELVADANIGQALPDKAWGCDNLSVNFSTGKGVLITLIHVLVSQELLDYDRPIADDWSEFANNGKEYITLRDVLTHQAGLFDITAITDQSDDMLDWKAMLSSVENMSPSKPKNTQAQSAYSALVSGWVLGGLIEKVTDLSLNAALVKYLTKPLGIEKEVYFGVPESQLSNVATLPKYFAKVDGEVGNKELAKSNAKRTKPTMKADSVNTLTTYEQLPSYECWKSHAKRFADHNAKGQDDEKDNNNKQDAAVDSSLKKLTTAGINKLYFDMSQLNFTDYKAALVPDIKEPLNYYLPQSLKACIPAANGVASARALGTIYAMLAHNGEWHGRRYINPDIMQVLKEIYVTGSDAVMPSIHPNSMLWRLGYHRIFSICHDTENGFGHMGYNGSFGYCDLSRKLSFAFVHNFDVTMMTDIRQFAITEAILKWIDASNE